MLDKYLKPLKQCFTTHFTAQHSQTYKYLLTLILTGTGYRVFLPISGCLLIVSSSSSKGARCLIKQTTLPSLLNTGLFEPD